LNIVRAHSLVDLSITVPLSFISLRSLSKLIKVGNKGIELSDFEY
jgi:hypothetical protein